MLSATMTRGLQRTRGGPSDPETGLLSQIVDAANGGPQKRARAAAALTAAKSAALEREALEREMAWMQQGQLLVANRSNQQTQVALEAQRQQGKVKMVAGVAAAGLLGIILWRRLGS